MKHINLNFRHPVEGKVRFLPIVSKISKACSMLINSKDNLVEIPVDHLDPGKWKVFFDWKHDGRNFSYQTELDIQR